LASKDHILLEHYKSVAKIFGHAPTSTMKDQKVRAAELDFFCSELDPLFVKNKKLQILDIGCGNGYLLSVLAKRYPEAKLYGIDLTPEFYELAKGRRLKNTNIEIADCREIHFFNKKIDIIITERVIINILSMAERAQAFKNIASLLPEGGLYLMSESFELPLRNLNKAREENQLPIIEVHKKNHYLLEEELQILKDSGLQEFPSLIGKNYLSTWFFSSRILHHLLKPQNLKKEGHSIMDFFSEGIGPGVGNYSPILFRKFIKEGS